MRGEPLFGLFWPGLEDVDSRGNEKVNKHQRNESVPSDTRFEVRL
jgi:hypothetical protein